MARERSHIKVYVCEKPPQNHEINNSTAYPRAFFRILTKSISTEDITAERDVRSPTICTFASDAWWSHPHEYLTDRKTILVSFYDSECAHSPLDSCYSFQQKLPESGDAVVGVFEKGPKDNESAAVRDAAFVATVEYLSVADGRQWAHCWAAGWKASITPHQIDADAMVWLNDYVSNFLSQLVPPFIVIWNRRWLDPFPLRTIYQHCRMCFGWQCCTSTSIRKIFFMLVSYDRRARQAGLMVIAANAEGTSNDKLNVLDNIVRFLPEAILLSG